MVGCLNTDMYYPQVRWNKAALLLPDARRKGAFDGLLPSSYAMRRIAYLLQFTPRQKVLASSYATQDMHDPRLLACLPRPVSRALGAIDCLTCSAALSFTYPEAIV